MVAGGFTLQFQATFSIAGSRPVCQDNTSRCIRAWKQFAEDNKVWIQDDQYGDKGHTEHDDCWACKYGEGCAKGYNAEGYML